MTLNRKFLLPAIAVVAAILVAPAMPVSAQSWPQVFDPFVLRTFNLELDPADWDVIRFDATNDIEVPAMFWADDESPILVSVRRKSSRALPSEANPIKIGLKIDINEFVSGQQWHGLVKLSLENAGDLPVLHEGMAWQLHQLAAQAGFYGPEAYPALANWVKVYVNGEYVGVYSNVEQRDTQFLRNRGVRVSGKTWLYEIDDIDNWELESGNPHSPTFLTLCYSPFAPTGKGKKAGACPTPGEAELEAELDSLIEMDAMLAQGAVDAFTDNPDALFSHGKNFFFADFDHSGLKRRYYPWDLDAVFRKTDANVYGVAQKRGLAQTPYQKILLNHPGFRARYNQILAELIAGRLSESNLHNFLDTLEPILAQAILDDPYISEDPATTFASLRSWISARIANVCTQIDCNDITANSVGSPTNNSAAAVNETGEMPHSFALRQNYPNPFNPSTTIKYDLPEGGFVKLRIFDMLGRQVAVLVEEEKPMGSHTVTFDASNLPSGMYFYRLQAGSFTQNRKMLLIK